MRAKLFLIPGFLGQEEDFSPLRRALRDIAPFLVTEVIDLPRSRPELSCLTIGPVGEALVAEMEKRRDPSLPSLALGYSLGGRLLLQVLGQRAGFPEGLIFVSTNPGLSSKSDKEGRRRNDLRWAERFLHENWESVLRDWNSQDVFAGGHAEPPRQEKDFDRSVLAGILTQWSLAEQMDFRELAGKDSRPQLWFAGERDRKFCSLLESLPSSAKLQKEVVTQAGHRVHLDGPESLARRLVSWLDRLKIGPLKMADS